MKRAYDDINDVIYKRDHSCGLMGSGFYYKIPPNIHHLYKSGKEFETKKPFKLRTDCKRATLGVGSDKDKLKRYFIEPHNKMMCQSLRGEWDPKAVNRSNKFMRGTCFTNKIDSHCSKYAVPELLRREDIKDRNKRITAAAKTCNSDNQCSWIKSKGQPYDCARKGSIDALTVVDKPPDIMPSDITKGKAEEFLYNWYMGKKHGPAPHVGEVFGEGDRCNISKPEIITNEKATDQEKLKTLGYDVQFFSKWQKTDKDAYREAMSAVSSEYDLYIEDEKFNMDQKPTMLLTIVQSVVNMVMKNLAIKGGTNRGIMAVHSTGSGKTCCATGVFDALWDTDMQIVFASSLDAIASNPDDKFHDCAKRFFPRFKNMPDVPSAFAERHITFLPFAKLANRIAKTENLKKLLRNKKASKTNKEILSKRVTNASVLVDHIHKHYKVDKSFIANALKECRINGFEDYVDLDNCCLIVDEVHNLFRPLATQKAKHALVEKHIVDPKKHPNLKVVIMTATPGDNITDIIKLINIVRDPTHDPIKAPDVNNVDSMLKFKNSIRGLISYLDMSSDDTKFPIVHDEGPIKYPMSTTQFAKYIDAYKAVKSTNQNYAQLAKDNQLNKYWSGARKYSNMLYKFEQGMKLTEFSSKLPALLETISMYPTEKHYAYSSFYDARGSGQGILEIARSLEKQGYKKLTLAEAKKSPLSLKKGKRYILAIQKELGEEGTSTAGKNLNALINVYNKVENKNGELVHVFLASQSFNEGIDLRGVKHIHFFEPLITMASDMQTIGRARRYCSHSDLDRSKGEWSIKLHRYLSDFPSDLEINNKNDNSNDVSGELARLTDELTEMKGMRAKALTQRYGDAGYRDKVKAQIADLKKQLKVPRTSKKKTVDASNVKMIDEMIFQESIEKFKELVLIHQAIKESAIDCRLLSTFHGVKCHDSK